MPSSYLPRVPHPSSVLSTQTLAAGLRWQIYLDFPDLMVRFTDDLNNRLKSWPFRLDLTLPLHRRWLFRYFEERFDIDSGSLGFMSSYRACLSFVVQASAWETAY